MIRNRRVRVASLAVATSGALLAAAFTASHPAGATTGDAFIRLNQVGFATLNPDKRALLMSSVAEDGATFTVTDTSTNGVVASGPIGADLGSWSSAYPHVYEIAFGGLQTQGSYDITVDGPAPASSPTFEISTSHDLYGQLEYDTLQYFHEQRDGADQYSPAILDRQPSHLHDAAAWTYQRPSVNATTNVVGALTRIGSATMNAMGGWHDAGDYMKFVQTTSYVEDLMLFGTMHYPTMGSGAGDFHGEARRGLDWLQEMWNDKTKTLYYQVGLQDRNSAGYQGDHDIDGLTPGWRLPEADDQLGIAPTSTKDKRYYLEYRPVFRAAAAGARISPNLAGRLAAAFALCYRLYRTSDPSYANKCLLEAEHVYALAVTSDSQTNSATAANQLLTGTPRSDEVEWRDDLELGAAEIALALEAGTPPAGLPHAAAAYYLHNTSNTGAGDWAAKYLSSYYATTSCTINNKSNLPIRCAQFYPDTMNNDDVSGLAHYELYQAMNATAPVTGMKVTASALVQNMHDQLAFWAANPHPFGEAYNFDNAPAYHGLGAVFMTALYDELPPPSDDPSTFQDLASRQLDYVLGANAWGTSFVIGAGSTFVQCPQNLPANINGSLDGGTPVLIGGIVTGGHDDPSEVDTTQHFGDDPAEPYEHTCDRQTSQFNAPDAVFFDNAANAESTEPAINFTITGTLAFAAAAGG